MDNKTQSKLIKLNRDFYDSIWEYFNTSRQFYWDGWSKLLPHLEGQSLKVLDLGCGNGRFGEFLKEHKKINYWGVDDSKDLLKVAKKKHPKSNFLKVNLNENWSNIPNDFDLVALMAVLHHIPGRENRLKVLEKARDRLKKDGILVFTGWHFNKMKRFSKGVVDKNKLDDLNDLTLEKGDYILDWKRGKIAYRYVHLFDDEEIGWLVKSLKMELLADFVSDGHQGQGNRYVVLKKN